MLKKATSWC